ncbi:2Fe-2S iron-sulfur cluster-binding protein [Streptomyces sp. KM273126]|uniref:2Fe-2S iron-sulfur cluster-binding protein n=1 Tax=Streptomyces sp. KM273126 TaxID=2545247 RepID=UPI001405047E|nr:2Fe-2S iron-sulfur cluster-binding protein [Streptomyces sp. KM273126]
MGASVTPLGVPRRLLEFTIDGEPVRAPEGSTILDACRAAGGRGFDARIAVEHDAPLTDSACVYCGVGCKLTLHVQDNEIVKVTSPLDNPVTHGNLCIKGSFGYQHVQNRD